MIKKVLNKQAHTIRSAAWILVLSSLLSAVLGLFRDRLLAGKFGAGIQLDIYYAAFRIPDFIFAVLISGGITAAFLPVFSQYFLKNKEEAWELTNNILNIFLVVSIFFCLILIIITPFLINLIVPGFGPNEKKLTILLTRILFLSPIFLGLSSIFSRCE